MLRVGERGGLGAGLGAGDKLGKIIEWARENGQADALIRRSVVVWRHKHAADPDFRARSV